MHKFEHIISRALQYHTRTGPGEGAGGGSVGKGVGRVTPVGAVVLFVPWASTAAMSRARENTTHFIFDWIEKDIEEEEEEEWRV